jgi:hypothetical protein
MKLILKFALAALLVAFLALPALARSQHQGSETMHPSKSSEEPQTSDAGGKAQGKRNYEPIHIIKESDKSSPMMMHKGPQEGTKRRIPQEGELK